MLSLAARRVQRTLCKRSAVFSHQMSTFEKDEDGIIHINTEKDWETLVATGQPIVADFWAPWCGKCSQIAGFYAILAEDYPSVTFVKLNVGEEGVTPIKEKLKVEALPAFHFFNQGKEVGKSILGYKKAPLKEQVIKLAGN